ncbi:MAG: twin-arginine translocation signal domain-containing protein [Gammaproteobacteria bacterium]|nr:twin-arginine translocation signal domain-containing protein [Gammaproteobacteria bacterium]
MNKKSQLKSQERREFIKKSTLVGSAVAASTVASTNAIAQFGDTTEEKPRQKGYQLTQHVIDYYKSADI